MSLEQDVIREMQQPHMTAGEGDIGLPDRESLEKQIEEMRRDIRGLKRAVKYLAHVLDPERPSR